MRTNSIALFITMGSDHCPAMKGIETKPINSPKIRTISGSDHCPAMKGIETNSSRMGLWQESCEATTAPQ